MIQSKHYWNFLPLDSFELPQKDFPGRNDVLRGMLYTVSFVLECTKRNRFALPIQAYYKNLLIIIENEINGSNSNSFNDDLPF